jgi:uncharacterized membrane protein (UPF0127 family)
MKKILVLLIFFIIFCVFIFFAFLNREGKIEQMQFKEIKIGDDLFKVEIADTLIKQARGLSGRNELAENEGMFFVFDKPGIYGFWMKKMKFPIDIIWMSGDKIVGFEENLPIDVSNSLKIYYPAQSVDKVLEVNAGLVKEKNIQIGQLVEVLK